MSTKQKWVDVLFGNCYLSVISFKAGECLENTLIQRIYNSQRNLHGLVIWTPMALFAIQIPFTVVAVLSDQGNPIPFFGPLVIFVGAMLLSLPPAFIHAHAVEKDQTKSMSGWKHHLVELIYYAVGLWLLKQLARLVYGQPPFLFVFAPSLPAKVIAAIGASVDIVVVGSIAVTCCAAVTLMASYKIEQSK